MNRYHLLASATLMALAGCKGSSDAQATRELQPGAASTPAATGAVEHGVEDHGKGSGHHGGKEIIATIDGEPIYRDDVESRVALRLYQLRADIHSLLTGETEAIIEARLLEREATRRGVSVDELLRTEVDARLAPVADADMDAYLATEARPGAGTGDKARARVAYYLKERRRIERRLAYVQSLRERADISIELARPERPRTAMELAGAPARGPEDAAVTVVHFASLSAPDSARTAAELRAIFERYPGAIRWLHRYHVDIYDELALRAAKLALVAEDQGRFWDFHDRVLGRPDALTAEALSAIASELGLDEKPAAEADLLRRLKVHFDIGRKAGVDRAPVVFVNGRYFNSTFSYQELHAMVAEELAAAGKRARSP